MLLVGTLVSLALFAATRARERAALRIDLERRAGHVLQSVRTSFDVPLEVLRSIPDLFEASEEVSRAEFRSFVSAALGRYPWIYALEWIPRVPGHERKRYEAMAVADGLAGYEFKQDAPNGPPVPADEREEYLPLFYMEPPNPIALGLEETALPARRLAIEQARDLGTTVITQRLKLVQDPPSVFSVIAFHPVYARGERPKTIEARRESVRGYAAAVFRIKPVLETALQQLEADRLDIVLVDDGTQPPTLLYESRAGAVEALIASGSAAWEQTTNIAGRRWTVRVSDRGGWAQHATGGFPLLGLGLLASVLAAGLMYALQTALRLRQQVHAAMRLGQYTLVERLGEGGMGTVYRAHHAMLRRPTAIKLLHSTRNDARALARFESEVQLTSLLTHPNTVVVYDYGRTPQGVFYYAMEYIEGITLQELVDVDGRQPPERVVHILTQVCDALAEAHDIGLVHRDIKPANVMLCRRGGVDDFVKVLDFGLAKDLSDSQRADLSQSAVLIGTPLYMAPEVALRKPVDSRTDLYAVGAMAYFLLTGTPVFRGSTVLEICCKHLANAPDSLSERLGAPVLPELEQLVMRCLAKEPAERPSAAREIARALRDLPLPHWTTERAQAWWSERGAVLEDAVRKARQPREQSSTSQTLEVDRRRPEPSGGPTRDPVSAQGA